MATEYKTIYGRKPGGILPFTMDNSGLLNVYPTEIFCRVVDKDGDMCINYTKFDSTNSLRLHIKNKHGKGLCRTFVKPSDEIMKIANKDFKNCYEAIVANDKKLRDAAAQHLNISSGSTTKKRKRHEREKNATEDSGEESPTPKVSKEKKPRKTTSRKTFSPPDQEPSGHPQTGLKTTGPLLDKEDPRNFVKTVKGMQSYNLSAMRKYAGVRNTKCSSCTTSKSSPCPPTDCDNWEMHSCKVLARFVQPEDEC